jgi:transcription elongation factor GreA
MEKYPMTQQGYITLKEELSRLKNIERPDVIRSLSYARALGDLSENAEYHAARERQAFVEGRIVDLEYKLSNSEVIDPKKMSGFIVRFGATVSLVDEDTDDEMSYQIVGIDEADLSKNRLSYASPLAKAIIGKSIGDSVDVQTPKGSKHYEILKVIYI